MELEIIGESLAEAIVDLNKFKSILGNKWNLEMAIKESTKITKLINAIKTEQFLKLIWLTLDWGYLINALKDNEQKEMNIKAYIIKYKNWPMFSPKITNGRRFEINVEEKEGTEVILIQSLMEGMSFNIKNFIDNNQFKYGYPPKKWVIDISEITGTTK